MTERVTVRAPTSDDDAELQRIDVLTCTTQASPAPAPTLGELFFEGADPADTLVAEIGGAIAGWTRLGPFYEWGPTCGPARSTSPVA